ncbi:CBU_0592 family membrane protein [Pedobacter sp. SAFR-022]|uniref:CBU_0592 family membrane protein n=1 Tax=Pedobacter sp. SAFR-022 TaxID=3436861 RepID=UPI003F7F027A
MSTSDILATAGVTILLVAFLLQILKVIKVESNWYSLMNLVGAALAGISAWMINFMPFVILESVWVVVSLFNLLKNLKSNNARGTRA